METKLKNISITILIISIMGTSILITGYLGIIPLFGDDEPDLQIIDMFGRQVEVNKDIDSIVATGAGALRYIAYLDAIDKVCGVENIELGENIDPTLELRPYNLAYPELRSLPSIGPQWGGDAELIIASGAEIIFTTNYLQASDIDALQSQLGIPVIGLIYGDLDVNINALWEGLNITATILGKEERFIQLKNGILSIITDLNERTNSIIIEERPSCYVGGIGYQGTHGITSTKSGYDSFDFVHANNVAADLEGDHQFIDKEQLFDWNPKKIFIDGGGFTLTHQDLNSGDYDTIAAVQSNEIYVLMPYNYYTANFANILLNSYFIGKTLYPTQFDDIDLNSTATEIYTLFIGSDVFDLIMRNFKNSIMSNQDALCQLGSLYS